MQAAQERYESLKPEMQQYRQGWRALPHSYIAFHEDLARTALEAMRTTHRVWVHRTYMTVDGWGDGMRVLHAVIETQSGQLHRLKWLDCSAKGLFHRVLPKGGSVMMFKKDWV